MRKYTYAIPRYTAPECTSENGVDSSDRTHELAEIPLADNIRPAGVCAYVRTDARQERGRRTAWQQREVSDEKQRERNRER